jgi:glycerophosphoryl diester phosphodiesterase
MKIIPWTVNKKTEIDALIAMGVDGIITDYPNLIEK